MSAAVQVEHQPPLASGWLPVALAWDRDGGRVEWLRFGETGLSDPFFHQTVNRVRAEGSDAAGTVITGVDAVPKLAEALPEVQVRGLIFHVSRCGSTLVGNALRSGAVVLSEAAPVNTVFWPKRLQSLPDDLRLRLLPDLARIYGNHCARGNGLVIKFSSWNILSWRMVRQVWPDVPCIVIVRDPVEVIVSNLQREPQWMQWRANFGIVAREVFGWQDVPEKPEEFCARVIGRFCEEGLELARAGCHVVDYSQLDVDRVLGIAAEFQVAATADDCKAVFQVHSKDPTASRAYASDIQSKQSAATDKIRQAAGTWAHSAYAELRKLC